MNLRNYIILGAVLLCIVGFPIIVNNLMAYRFGTVYGNESTWITFFGSYLGAVVSGLITILGVYMTIRFTQEQNRKTLEVAEEQNRRNLEFTQEQNRINLEVTQQLNAEALEFTQKENRREKLPVMIHNLEECLDFIRDTAEELEIASRGSFEEVLFVSISDRELKLHYVNDIYHVAKKDNLVDFTKNYLKKIRIYTVNVNAGAYDAFLQFSSDLELAYGRNMYKIEKEFISFQMGMMNDYMETDDMTLISDDGKLTDIELMDEDKMRLKGMKRNLYLAEIEYLGEITKFYNDLYEALEDELLSLITEFNG